jgi:hypothetical protein
LPPPTVLADGLSYVLVNLWRLSLHTLILMMESQLESLELLFLSSKSIVRLADIEEDFE